MRRKIDVQGGQLARFGQLNGAKLPLERRFGWPWSQGGPGTASSEPWNGAKLALERRFRRKDSLRAFVDPKAGRHFYE